MSRAKRAKIPPCGLFLVFKLEEIEMSLEQLESRLKLSDRDRPVLDGEIPNSAEFTRIICD